MRTPYIAALGTKMEPGLKAAAPGLSLLLFRSRRRRPDCGQQRELECRSLAFHRTDFEDRSVRFHDMPHQREPQARAAGAASGRGIQLLEWFKDLLQVLRRDTDACV